MCGMRVVTLYLWCHPVWCADERLTLHHESLCQLGSNAKVSCVCVCVHTCQLQQCIDNHGSGYLGMAKGFQCTRQISGRLSRILPQLQSHTD